MTRVVITALDLRNKTHAHTFTYSIASSGQVASRAIVCSTCAKTTTSHLNEVRVAVDRINEDGKPEEHEQETEI